MKLFNFLSKFAVFILIISSIASLAILKNNKFSFKQDDIKGIWEQLFSKPQGEKCAPLSPQELKALKIVANVEPEGITWSVPRKKINRYDKEQGYGASAYFFDYLDDVFKEDISKEFKRVFDEVKALTPDAKDYTDPYPLSKLVSSLSTENTANAADPGDIPVAPPTPPKDEELLEKLKSITKGNNNIFNEKSWKNSVTAANIFNAVKDFQWNHNPNEVNWAKRIVDKYDFDGDGRLNPREFIIMTIFHNANILGTTCKNCYNDIINKKIDPIYTYFDCDKDNKISAEDVWKNLKSLKRKSPGKNDIYKCRVKGRRYRTSAVNDFFIKNMISFDGYLSKQEFRAGILLGYWDRHTDVENIYLDDKKTFKKLRWGEDEDRDIVCERINRLAVNDLSVTKAEPKKQ